MKKLILSSVILIILLATGCNKTIECSDFSCFKEAVKNGSNAKGSVAIEVSFFSNVEISSTQRFEIIKDRDVYTVLITQEKYEAINFDGSEFSTGTATGDDALKEIIGKTGECKYSMEEIQNLFSDLEKGIYSTEHISKCTGELFASQVF